MPVHWLDGPQGTLVSTMGTKFARLGDMSGASIPVPPGFAVTTYGFKDFMDSTGVGEKVGQIMQRLTDPDDLGALEAVSAEIRATIEAAPITDRVRRAVAAAYDLLGERVRQPGLKVAVRSSSTKEDLKDASFAGQFDSYLGISGEVDVLSYVRKCWSSLYTARAIGYRIKTGLAHDEALIAVGVQALVDAKASGVMFTLDPITGDENRLTVEANWGLGEAVVQGVVTPDRYVIDRNTLEVIERHVNKKKIISTFSPEANHVIETDMPEELQDKPCMTDAELKRLVELGLAIEAKYGGCQDIEWSVDRRLPEGENVFVVQSRPETVWAAKKAEQKALAEQPYEALNYMFKYVFKMGQ